MTTGADSFDPSLQPAGRMSSAVAALRNWASKLPRPYATFGYAAAVPGREAANGGESSPDAGPTAAARDPLQQWNEIALRTFIAVGIFSVFVNLLMLTMPIYLFQISDRVLTSRSMDTLVMLSLLALGFILVLSLLDTLRRQVLGRLATRMETILGGPVIASVVTSAPASDGGNMQPLRSLHQVRGFMSSPTMLILFDAPMAPLYFAAVFLIHPSLGFVTLAAGGAAACHRLHQPARDLGPARPGRACTHPRPTRRPMRWRATPRSSTPWACSTRASCNGAASRPARSPSR